MPAVTRRQFVATVGAIAALGKRLFPERSPLLIQNVKAARAPVQEDKWIPTACWMCREACGILAHRVNGVVVKIEGNPKCPKNLGRTCARAQGAIMKLYNPYRVKAPVKRTNPEKGPGVDPGWVEISWDEAFDIVAQRLKKIRAENPNKFVYTYGWGGGYSGGMAPFHRAFGSVNGMSGFGGLICGAGMHTASYLVHGTSSHGSDDEYVKYMIRGGAAQGVNKAGVADTRRFVQARERGMRFITVDPRFSEEAAKSDEWIPIRPGSDRLMHLAMMNVLLNELNVYDVEFIKRRTNGPYLIQPDGYYLRSKTALVDDPVRKAKLGKPMVWDAKEGKAKVFDDPTIAHWNDLALEGEYEVDGVKVKPAFQLFKEHVKQYTPEMAERVTTVPAATIRRLARELAEAAQIGSTIEINGTTFPYRPVGSRWRGGRNKHHATWDSLTNILLYMLVGALDVPGGLLGGNADLTPNPADGVVAPKGSARYRFKWPPDAYMWETWYPIAYKTVATAYKAILEPEKYGLQYPVEALMIHGCNPLMAGGSTDKMVAAFKKIPFIFSISYHFDEATEMADVVFPEPGFPGWLRLSKGGPWIHQPMLERDLYDTRLPEDIHTEIAYRVGFLDKWNDVLNKQLKLKGEYKLLPTKKYSWEEILDRQLRSNFGPSFGLAWFKENGVFQVKEDPRERYGFYKWPWDKTRYPLYFEYLKWAGDQLKADLAKVGQDLERIHPGAYKDYTPLPFWEDSNITTAPPEYDLWLINWKGTTMTMGQTMDNPWLRELMDRFDPYSMYAWINKETAAKKGLKDGDLVWVESGTSGLRVQAEVRVSECIHPQALAIGGEFGQWSPDYSPVGRNKGPHYNTLISFDEKYMDPLCGGFDYQAKVKVYKV